MLAIRPTCEHCNKLLPNESEEAMICSFECTYCIDCVTTILHNVCPNCGGGFTLRPTRPTHYLEKYPVSTEIVHKPIDMDSFSKLVERYRHIDVRER